MRRVKRVVASRGRALTCAVLRAHKCSLFFGHFSPSPRGGSGCFFHDCGAKKGRKTQIFSTSHPKGGASARFPRGICARLWKSCAKTKSVRPTQHIIWVHGSETIPEIERELCKRIGRGAPVLRLPLRLGCKRSAPARPLSLAPPRRPPPPAHCRRAPPPLSARPARP